MCLLSLNGVEAVPSGDVIESVTDVDAPDMAIACEAEIVGIDLMRAEDTDRVWSDEEVIAVEFDAGLIVVVVEAELCGVAWEQEVLAEVVEDESVLVAVIKGIKEAVGFLFGLIKPNDVELIAVGEPRAEESDGAVGISEDKASKVAYERLRAGTNGEEIVVGAEVSEFCFDEPFFQCGVESRAGRTTADVGVDNSEFVDVEVVKVEHGGNADLPVEGFESGITVGEVKLEFEVVDEEVLFGITVEFCLSRVGGAFERRCGDGCMAKFMEHEVDSGDIQKRVLSDDGVVTFEDILVVGVPPIACFPWLIDAPGVRFAVALPVREACAPAVFDGDEVKGLLAFAGANSGGSGVSARRANEGFDEVGCGWRGQEFFGNLIRRIGWLEDVGGGLWKGILLRLIFALLGCRCL